MDGRVFTCSCCNAFKSLTLRALLNHCFVVHRNEPNFQVACNVDGCPAVFKKYNSFYKHVCKQHRAVYDTQAQAPQQGTSTDKRQDRAEDEASNNNDQYQHNGNDDNDSEHSDMDEDMDENHQAADQVFNLYTLLDVLLIYIGILFV